MLKFYFYTITKGKEEKEIGMVPFRDERLLIPDKWSVIAFIERQVMDKFPSCMFVNMVAEGFKARFEAKKVYTTDDSGTFVDVVCRNLFWTDYR